MQINDRNRNRNAVYKEQSKNSVAKTLLNVI